MRREVIFLVVVGAVTFGAVYSIRAILTPPPPGEAPQFQIWHGATETKLWVEFSPDNFFEWGENSSMKILFANATPSTMTINGLAIYMINENTGFYTMPLPKRPPPLQPGQIILLHEKSGVVGDADTTGFLPGAVPEGLPGLWRVEVYCSTNIENFQTSARFYIAPPA